jgi:hypothetical protein
VVARKLVALVQMIRQMLNANNTPKGERPAPPGAIEINLDGRSFVSVVIKNRDKFLGTYRLVATKNDKCMLQK